MNKNTRWRQRKACQGLYYTAIETPMIRQEPIQIPLYKVELYDVAHWCPAFVSGTINIFCEDIEDFQRRWFKLETEEEPKERFLRSKNGEIVTDYYGNDPARNIVQHDLATVYAERTVILHSVSFGENEFSYDNMFYARRLELWFRWISFKGKYWRIASFTADGPCVKSILLRDGYREVDCDGNPFFENTLNAVTGGGRNRPDYWPLDFFSANRIVSIGFLESWLFRRKVLMEKDIRRFHITDKILERLFRNTM